MNQNIQLKQGQYYIADCNDKVETLLGSCISVIIWHASLKVGAMSHSIIDTRNNKNTQNLDSRYCDEAIKKMVHDLKMRGVKIEECHARIFGGASMLPKLKQAKIDEKNYNISLVQLNEYKIPIVEQKVLGDHYRKIFFDVNTGNVICNN